MERTYILIPMANDNCVGVAVAETKEEAILELIEAGKQFDLVSATVEETEWIPDRTDKLNYITSIVFVNRNTNEKETYDLFELNKRVNKASFIC